MLNRKYVPYDVQGSYLRVMVEMGGVEPPRRKVAARLASQLDPLRCRSAQKMLRILRTWGSTPARMKRIGPAKPKPEPSAAGPVLKGGAAE